MVVSEEGVSPLLSEVNTEEEGVYAPLWEVNTEEEGVFAPLSEGSIEKEVDALFLEIVIGRGSRCTTPGGC